VSAGVIWSFGALFARLADQADVWQYLLWRSIGVLVVMEVLHLRTSIRTAPTVDRRHRALVVTAWTSDRRMVAANLGLLVASLAYVYAVKTTTAANAAFLSSLTPLAAVVVARVVLRESLTKATVVAITVALFGLVVMVLADLEAGNMVGNASAVASSIGFAVFAVALRSDRQRNWSPVLPGYAIVMIGLCAVVTIVNGESLVPPTKSLGYALAHGAVLIVVGTLAYNAASSRVPAVAMTVFAQTETVFAPFWVFLVLNERPKTQTLIGAALILGAIVAKAVVDAAPRHA
jgi:drug/metabolite transporter, DME family